MCFPVLDEAFYRYKITDNISITPGLFVIFNPEHNDANDTIYVGTLLTTFTF
ncbi:MAG TPA: carbohydrate porin [Coleofasciculaceae cyanobacterium]